MLVELPQGEEGLDLLALGREERAAREGETAPRERGQRERDAGPGLECAASRSQVNNFPNYKSKIFFYKISFPRYGQPDTISTLLEHGIDINADNRGWTALHLAALNGHTDIASILLNKGAETARENQEGRTPLDIAR